MARFRCKVIGIDLGTTHTRVAYYDEKAQESKCCENLEGEELTPSAVYFESSDMCYVGQTAKQGVFVYADRIAMNFKRLMGVENMAIQVDGKTYSPQQLSAILLRNAVDDAKRILEEDITDVVITVPADFKNDNRKATIDAGKMAGLNVLAVLDEPVAAVFHYDSIEDLVDKTVMIFDLGGGTLDIVVVVVHEECIEEVAIHGNVNLGGSDWDKALLDYVKETYLQGKTLSMNDEQDLMLELENAKKKLSFREKTQVRINSNHGSKLITLTRKEFEDCTAHLLEKVRETLQGLMRELDNTEVEEFDKIMLVGGATRMTQITELLKKSFPYTKIVSKEADVAVAKGAAVYAKMLTEQKENLKIKRSFTEFDEKNNENMLAKTSTKSLSKISACSYGIAARLNYKGEGKICNIILKGEKLPIKVQREFYTSKATSANKEEKTYMPIRVYETTSLDRYVDLDEKYLLDELKLELVENLPQLSSVFVEFTLNEDGVLLVKAKEPTGVKAVQRIIKSKMLLTEEEIVTQSDEVGRITLISG